MITSKQIIRINEYLSPGNSYKANLIESALSSYHYYDSISDRISSIFRGLAKNHPFSDGNKRTAIVVLFYLSDKYNLKLINDIELEEAIIHIASSNIDVSEISNIIFI